MRLRCYICLMIADGAVELPMTLLAQGVDIFRIVLVILQVTVSILQCLGYYFENKCTSISYSTQRQVQILNCVTFTIQMIIQFELFFIQKCTIEVLRILTIMWLVNPIYRHQQQHIQVFAIIQTIILQVYTITRLGISVDGQQCIIRFSLFGFYTLIMIYFLLSELRIYIKYSQAVNSMDNSVQTKETMFIEDLIIQNIKVGVLVLNQELDVKVINNQLCNILGTTEANVLPELHKQLLCGLQQNGEAIQQTDIIKGRVSKRHLSMKANNNVIQTIVKSAEKQLKKMSSISEKVLEMQSKDRRRTRQQTQQSTFEQLFLSFYEKERKKKQTGLGISSKLKVNIQVGDAQKQFIIEFCQQNQDFHEVYYVLFMYDITKIETLQGQLQAQQFKTLHFNSFSHELRTPLNCSLSLLQAMESQNLSENIHINYLKPSIVANKLLMHQINDILDYAQFGFNNFKLNIQQCSITKLFSTLEEYYSQACRIKGIHLKFEIRSMNKVALHSDMERILQLSVNLLNNSIKFTPEGGQITMIAQQKRHSTGFMNEQWYKIIVYDTGCGINQVALQAIKDILKPLTMKNKLHQNIGLNTISQLSKFTAKYIGLGFTIGSKISSALAMSETENLKIKSVENRFTKVSFLVKNWANSLDCMISEHSGSERKESGIEYPDKEKDIISQVPIHLKQLQNHDLPQILICDDVAFNLLALQMLFQSLGFICDLAHDGRQAIQLVTQRQQQQVQQYKLIMMDIEMPVLNGYETTFEILQINNDINIVMCSAYDSQNNIQEAKECGMKMSITKPVKIERLKEVVTKFIH